MRSLIPLVLLLAIAIPVSAEHCVTWTTSDEAIPAGDLYVMFDPPCSPECIYGIWIYEETNGIPGLQRGDELHDDTCHGQIIPDTILF